MISHIELSLRAWHPNGNSISGDAFVNALAVNASKYFVTGTGQRWEAARIAVRVSLESFENSKEPHDAFANALRQAFIEFSELLSSVAINSVDVLREDGMILDLFIGLWIDQDQLDLELPPELVYELSRLGLSLKIISNE